MATTPELSQLRHVLVPGMLHFYYEKTERGNVLRHIRVNQHLFEVPAEGITIDALPADSVGSNQIQDGTVKASDLSQEVKDMMGAGGSVGIVDSDDPMNLLGD